MAAVSIKGTALSTLVEDVKRLVDEGHISREELEVRLEASDLALLEAKIEPASGEHIHGGGHFGQHDRVAKGHGADHRPKPNSHA